MATGDGLREHLVAAGGAAARSLGADRGFVHAVPAGGCGRRRGGPAAAFFGELAALGRPGTTHRSYGMDLLRWFRFIWAVEVPWDQATQAEARDYCRWIQLTAKPGRRRGQPGGAARGRGRRGCAEPGDRQAAAGQRVRCRDVRAQRDGAAFVL